MIECNSMIPVMNYGSSASYKAEPTPEQVANGVIPLDSLPAAWWNCMWSQTNTAVNQARDELGQLIVELNNVLCAAGVCPQDVCTNQLYQSIEKIRQTLGNATTAGAVKSSSNPSEVSINQTTGMMSVNCLGNAASLTTTARTVVGAVNELKSTYDQCFTDTATAIGGKAPTSHVSDLTTYGVGNADCYGHLKISDTYLCDLGCSGMAASQTAVACVYDCLSTVAAGVASLGNTAGCALGTAAAGTAITAARSDHVHPYSDRLNDSNGNVIRVEGGNELNFYSSGAWLNYRGGVNAINIGNGATNGGLGTLIAGLFCGPATQIYNNGVGGASFHWSGQGGQPTWLWGSNDGYNFYVWNPSNFNVSYANNAGYATCASVATCSEKTVYYNSNPGGSSSYLLFCFGSSGCLYPSGTKLYIGNQLQCNKSIWVPIW